MTPTKQQCTDLIDALADKELTFGCYVQNLKSGVIERVVSEHDGRATTPTLFAGCTLRDAEQFNKILGHDIYLHHVLEKIIEIAPEKLSIKDVTQLEARIYAMTIKWHLGGGASKSLQDIFQGMGWEEVYNPDRTSTVQYFNIATPSPAASLFEFLISLNLTK